MANAQNQKTQLQAEPTYEMGHGMARDLLERIGELLQDMPAPGNDDQPIHWGHVGDISHVNSLLVQAVHFLERRG